MKRHTAKALLHGVSLMIILTFKGDFNSVYAQSEKRLSVGICTFRIL